MFSKTLNEKLDQYHLLNHPFYRAWNEGKLTREIIKDYMNNITNIKAFPDILVQLIHYVRTLKKKILLENLQDEEDPNTDHPKLYFF